MYASRLQLPKRSIDDLGGSTRFVFIGKDPVNDRRYGLMETIEPHRQAVVACSELSLTRSVERENRETSSSELGPPVMQFLLVGVRATKH